MNPPSRRQSDATAQWDIQSCEDLISQLWTLRESMLEHASRLSERMAGVDPAHRAGATNLAHYLAFRRFDLRRLQERLAWMGVSSLGRAENHVLANVDKVLGILHRLAGKEWSALSGDEPAGFHSGHDLLAQHSERLFGPTPAERRVRVMVTLPSEAAADAALVASMIDAGMDIARINCAHDGPQEWMAMAHSVRKAARRAGRQVRVLMDLGGPKLRTGPFEQGPAVLKVKPRRDAFGHATMPARVALRSRRLQGPTADVDATLGVDPRWVDSLTVGDEVALVDARGARRRLKVVERRSGLAIVTCASAAYLCEQTQLSLSRPDHPDAHTSIDGISAAPGQVTLYRGDRVHLLATGAGGQDPSDGEGKRRPARIVCKLPEALPRLRSGQRVWFDDGRIGAVVRRRLKGKVELEITQARDGGEKLVADKGINLPDTELDLPALTENDLQDLEVAARHADLIGLSFAQSADDVQALRRRLQALDAPQVGLILKIETRRGFEHLPQMLLAAMSAPAAGVMIARGDLAVECGYERMAEVQEEILWACEAAHMPVVWATQVLETLAKTGLPSRAEITDAAMGVRAECVMLNKGPHILEAMRTLDDILRRMQAHQSKKRPLMRALKSWAA